MLCANDRGRRVARTRMTDERTSILNGVAVSVAEIVSLIEEESLMLSWSFLKVSKILAIISWQRAISIGVKRKGVEKPLSRIW